MDLFYKSTRNSNTKVTASQAILKGLAVDGGLFVPTQIPKLPVSLQELKDMSYQETAYTVMKEFFTDFTEEELKNCIAKAYDSKFDTEAIAPLSKVEGAYYLEGIKIIVFYPKNGVSKVQELQMITQKGANTSVVAVHGNFDNAQSGVKAMFEDKELARELEEAGYQFSSANSINIGRLIPQVVYYVYAYAKLLQNGEIAEGEEINVVVPTGNFGNILAAFYAKNMGLPIAKLICASNENKVLYDFFRTGTYDKNREFILTTSPSMDILISSNLERLIYLLTGKDDKKNQELMNELKEKGSYTINEDMKAQLKDFVGGYATEDEVKQTIHNIYKETGYVMDTHTAVAATVYQAYRKESKDEHKTVIASTASPYKFARSVMTAIDEKYNALEEFPLIDELQKVSGMTIPKAIEEIRNAQILHNTECDVDKMEDTVKMILQIQ